MTAIKCNKLRKYDSLYLVKPCGSTKNPSLFIFPDLCLDKPSEPLY